MVDSDVERTPDPRETLDRLRGRPFAVTTGWDPHLVLYDRLELLRAHHIDTLVHLGDYPFDIDRYGRSYSLESAQAELHRIGAMLLVESDRHDQMRYTVDHWPWLSVDLPAAQLRGLLPADLIAPEPQAPGRPAFLEVTADGEVHALGIDPDAWLIDEVAAAIESAVSEHPGPGYESADAMISVLRKSRERRTGTAGDRSE